jgi:NADPH-dependent 2,4-dienoyl-CoA reductase/sulfur reductase-like enzyme
MPRWRRTKTFPTGSSAAFGEMRKAGRVPSARKTVTEAMIDEARPDAVILAIGADKTACPAEGANASVVCDAWQILDGSVKPKEPAVIIGAGLVGLETADFMREKGLKNITVVEMLAKPPAWRRRSHGQMLYRRLAGRASAHVRNQR